jgi:hypothetical protein
MAGRDQFKAPPLIPIFTSGNSVLLNEIMLIWSSRKNSGFARPNWPNLGLLLRKHDKFPPRQIPPPSPGLGSGLGCGWA